PKTQSALLEAMNEGQVSVEGRPYPLPEPFMVVATQNPIEYHGTFPLPEAQLDRFLLRIEMGYPDAASEREILTRRNGRRPESLQPALHGDEVVELQQRAPDVRVDDEIVDYILAIVKATREHPRLALGVSPPRTARVDHAARAPAASGREILTRRNGRRPESLQPALHGDEVVELQQRAPDVRVDDEIVDYILAIVKATREHPRLALGVSPRGTIALYKAAQALALIEGLDFVTPHHAKSLAVPVFAHRVIPDRRARAEAGGVDRAREILEEILEATPAP